MNSSQKTVAWLLAGLCALAIESAPLRLIAAERTAGNEPAKYTATAYLLIAWAQPHMLPALAEKADPAEFEIYKATQRQLIQSPWVLTAASRDDEVKGLPNVRREDERHNAAAWLARQVHVAFPDKQTGLMTVSVTDSDPAEAATLVNAVVHAYMHECVDSEQIRRQARLNQLQQLYSDKETEARTRRSQLKEVAERLGISDSGGAKIRQQIALEKSLGSLRELAAAKHDLRRARGEVKVQKILKADTARPEAQVQVFEEMVQECQTEADRYAKEAEQISRASTDVEMQRAELKHLDQVFGSIADERERLQVELRSARRVTILGNPERPAEVPEHAD
jgi:hypothetical protein